MKRSHLRGLLPPPERDDRGLFLELRGMTTVWPTWQNRDTQPWPLEPGPRLRWLAEHPESEPWMPLAHEQDARWDDEFSEQAR